MPDPGSWILFITYPGSRIPDLGSRIQKQQQKRGLKKNLLSYLFLKPKISQNIKLFYFWNAEEKNLLKKNLLSYLFLKPKISQSIKLFYFWNAEEKNLFKFLKNYKTFTQKIVTKFTKIWVWYPGYEIRKKPSPDPRSMGQKGTGSWIRIHNTVIFGFKYYYY